MDDNFSLQLDDIEFDFNLEVENSDDTFVKLKNGFVSQKDVFYENAEQLAYDIHIKRGETVYCNLNGKFIFGDFISAFIRVNQLNVEELTIVSLSGGMDNFEMMDGLIENGWVKKLNLVLSKYFLRTEQKKHSPTIVFLKSLCEKYGDIFNVYYSNIHAKLVLMKTEHNGKNGFVVMHGSANLRSSQNIEQMIISENEELYNHNYKFFKNIM